MCNFCGSTKAEKDAIEKGLHMRALSMVSFSNSLRLMASGKIKPHTPKAVSLTTQAHELIRFLVEDFM